MNIVFQIGDALYEALPKEIAHKYFVDARQATNDVAIDFAKKLIKQSSLALLESIKYSIADAVVDEDSGYGDKSWFDTKNIGFNQANKQWRTTIDNKAKEIKGNSNTSEEA